MTDWFEGRLADACASIDYGLTASAALSPVGPKFLRITDIVGGALDWDSVPFVETDDQSTQKYRLNHMDIVIARTGATTGVSRFISDPPTAVFASYLVRLSIKPNFDARFIGYWLKSPAFWGYLKGVLGDKSAQPNASASTMTNAPMRVPSALAEQRAIAATLGALDDKIELNRKMNATLEAMARALFRDWFVDFGPTRAKMEARAPYLSPNLWSLFPTRLDDEGKPEGWEVSPLDALAEVTMGISPDGSTYNDDGQGTPLCNGPVEYGDFFLRQIKWTTAPSKLAQRGDLIICVRGSTTGRHAFADAEYCLGRGVASIRGKHDCQEFVETAILSQMNRLLEKTTGSVFPSLSTQDIKKFGLVDPGLSLRQAFCNAVRPMRAKIWAKVEESSTLGQIRDLLLPRLMSGELRVAEGERLVGEVA